MDVPDWHLPGFFPGIDHGIWETYRGLYPDALCAEEAAICTSATAYAVRTPEQTVLVDTGLGPGPHERAGNQKGRLMQELTAAGLRPEDFDLVIVTHMHVDHVGWNGVSEGGAVRASFPRARYLLPRKDWEHFSRPEIAERSPWLQATFALQERGLVDLVDGDRSIGAHLTLVPTPGHTPGHQAVAIVSGGDRAAILGDMAHTPAQVQETGWSPRADLDPVLSAETRARVFDRLEAEGALLCAGHFPHPGFGRLVRSGGRRIFQGVDSSS